MSLQMKLALSVCCPTVFLRHCSFVDLLFEMEQKLFACLYEIRNSNIYSVTLYRQPQTTFTLYKECLCNFQLFSSEFSLLEIVTKFF